MVSSRTERRLAERVQLNAAMCKVPLSSWVAMTRRERRRRLQNVRKETHRG
ncbi:hypothetical protein [Actinoplanes siamensis]|uniref:Uncharacterized protein n=1 Tax=Actinoplanes siamensis TaxID=1223317 RepID=A0A919NCI2_9ACTN|nr:hypothetical protein [Actinoplanes siamensis]GIF08697.1 hypothetical protein Asi03nite_62350 [Actinoplanes siamensis]